MAVEEEWLAELCDKLHDLCQPLTALQCRLEIGMMHGRLDTMRAAIEEALHECERMNNRVHTMQTLLSRVLERQQKERRS
ncbi:HAMP domain-containing histidine kinase [Granulicella rosea]|uniref:HAMP domain-containing histidine kinase n=1 Tax=Granulicella rosea TaxID=474952 RepID=UPI00115EE1B8|nr:HAMP domain-containing histidine kinase [Granulicella rosea]